VIWQLDALNEKPLGSEGVIVQDETGPPVLMTDMGVIA